MDRGCAEETAESETHENCMKNDWKHVPPATNHLVFISWHTRLLHGNKFFARKKMSGAGTRNNRGRCSETRFAFDPTPY
jgi:hypothetical protein